MIIAYTGFAAYGLMFISQCGAMAVEIGHLSKVAGVVMAISLGNIAGRLFWGPLSDRIGKYAVLTAAAGVITIGGLMLFVTGNSMMVFVACAVTIVFAYGGCASCFPALVADRYGVKSSALNYGIICIGYSAGGYIGPISATKLYYLTGSYTFAFLMACTVGAIVLLCMITLMKSEKKEKRNLF